LTTKEIRRTCFRILCIFIFSVSLSWVFLFLMKICSFNDSLCFSLVFFFVLFPWRPNLPNGNCSRCIIQARFTFIKADTMINIIDETFSLLYLHITINFWGEKDRKQNRGQLLLPQKINTTFLLNLHEQCYHSYSSTANLSKNLNVARPNLNSCTASSVPLTK
jgi:hypothetical protein